MGLAQNSVRGIKFPNHSIYVFSGNGLIFGWTVPHFCLQWWEPPGRLKFFSNDFGKSKNGDDSPTAGFQLAAFWDARTNAGAYKAHVWWPRPLGHKKGPSNEGKNIQLYKGICQPLSIFRTNYQDPPGMNVFLLYFCIQWTSESTSIYQRCFFTRGRWSGQMTQMTPTRRAPKATWIPF